MIFLRSVLSAAVLAVALPAAAVQTVTLTFDEAGVDSQFFSQPVGSFYQDNGVLFDSAAFALRNDSVGTYFNNAPSPLGVLAFDGATSSVVMNAVAGKPFLQGLAFHYSSTVDVAQAVSIYEGANGTGNLLASLSLLENNANSGCTGSSYCDWQSMSINFTGEAGSVVLSTANGQIAYDNISVTAVPEPGALALVLAGLGTVSLLARRRR